MKIINCDDSHRDAWNAFVDTADGASLYHRYEWRRVNQQCFGHRSAYLAALDGDRIAGVFPIVRVQSRLFGNIACSLPFVNFGGPCASTPEIERVLIAKASEIADEWRVDYVEIRSRKFLDGLPSSDHKVSMTLDLNKDPDVLWKKFSSSHRQDIRKGYKNGLTARIGGAELIPDFYAVLSESWRDLGTPIYSRSYLETVAATFPEATRLCVVYAGTEPAAASLDMLHGETAEGLWLGSRGKFRSQYAGYVLYWELIKGACERGMTRFHLGRSTVQSGGEVFKKKWNAKPLQLYWQYVLRTRRDIPQLNVANPKYRLAIRAWQQLPVPVTQVIGPFIARSIP
ncbi:MAG TPA: FemAB family XrtA/PEP-CTERM system-associated protein [Vicinamibacterales bacterium]|jgi:FemAB-related protein (PEP-CTERM system-associated)